MASLSRRSLTVGLAGSLAGCRKPAREAHSLVEAVFLGFDYVGEFPANDVDLGSRRHEKTGLPERLGPGPQYVFHLENDRDFEEIPTRLLPSRLRAAGATVIDAPKSWRDMAIPNIGNPIWWIEFTYGRYRGRIRNCIDMKRWEQFSSSARDPRRNASDPRIDHYVLTMAT